MDVKRIQDKFKKHDLKLKSLLKITKAINDNALVSSLITIYKDFVQNELGIYKLMLYSKTPEWQVLLKYGISDQLNFDGLENKLKGYTDFNVMESVQGTLNVFDIVVPIFHHNEPYAYLLIGDSNEDAITISPAIKHMSYIQTLTNILVVAIINKRLEEERIQKQLIQRELKMASEMQSFLFPNHLPNNSILEIAAKYISYGELGGDYYDVIELTPNSYLLCIADVSGKGPSAAILMATFQANLRALVKFNPSIDLKELLIELNQTVCENSKGEKFITFFVGIYHIDDRIFEYVNAGHNPPLLKNKDEIMVLSGGCPGLGMFDQLSYIQSQVISVKPDDVLVCFTDGLIEMENSKEEAFEHDRVVQVLHENASLSMEKLVDQYFKVIDEYVSQVGLKDDTTILCTRFK